MRLLFIIAGSTIGLALPAFAQEQNSAFLLPLGKGYYSRRERISQQIPLGSFQKSD
jgi:hypothetical protein